MIKTSIYAVSCSVPVWLPQSDDDKDHITNQAESQVSSRFPQFLSSLFEKPIIKLMSRIDFRSSKLWSYPEQITPSNRRGFYWTYSRVCFCFHDLIIVESFKNDCLSFCFFFFCSTMLSSTSQRSVSIVFHSVESSSLSIRTSWHRQIEVSRGSIWPELSLCISISGCASWCFFGHSFSMRAKFSLSVSRWFDRHLEGQS
jgi:hypothetical protein